MPGSKVLIRKGTIVYERPTKGKLQWQANHTGGQTTRCVCDLGEADNLPIRQRKPLQPMKFHLTQPDGRNLFTGYGPGYLSVNGIRHENSLIVLPDRIAQWEVNSFEALDEAAFEQLAQLPVEILLLGTGTALRFPHPRLTQAVRNAGIGLEVMDTSAACRTYNILLGEDRRAGAALLLSATDQPGL